MHKSIIAIALLLILISSSTISGQPGNHTMYYDGAYIVQYINMPGCVPPTCILTGTGNAPHCMPVLACCIDSTRPFYNGSEIVILKQKVNTASKNSEPAYIQFFDSAAHGNLGKIHTLEELFFLVTDTSQIYSNEALVNSYLDSANVINQNIIPQIIVETNKKTINNLYINKMVKNNFNFAANEKQNVSNIASQCPYAGGPAVTEARAIERVWNDTVLHDDTWLCMSAPEIGKHEKSEKLTDGIFVYPNPAKDVLNVRSDIKGTIILTDVTGRQITKTKNENLITTIDTRRVNQGVYLLSVYISDKLVHAIRVVIIK